MRAPLAFAGGAVHSKSDRAHRGTPVTAGLLGDQEEVQ